PAWSADKANAVLHAFEATRRPYATASARAVRERLDGYAAQWASIHRETCMAKELRHERTAALHDRQMACLDRARQSTGEFVEALTRADGATVDAALRGVDELPLLSHRADLEAMAQSEGRTPLDTEKHAPVKTPRGQPDMRRWPQMH